MEEEQLPLSVTHAFLRCQDQWQKGKHYTSRPIIFWTKKMDEKEGLFSSLRYQHFNIRRLSYATLDSELEGFMIFSPGPTTKFLNRWDSLPLYVKLVPIPLTFLMPKIFGGIILVIYIFIFALWAIFHVLFSWVIPEDDTPSPL